MNAFKIDLVYFNHEDIETHNSLTDLFYFNQGDIEAQNATLALTMVSHHDVEPYQPGSMVHDHDVGPYQLGSMVKATVSNHYAKLLDSKRVDGSNLGEMSKEICLSVDGRAGLIRPCVGNGNDAHVVHDIFFVV